jgi:putative NADH-flavin reductase
MKVAIFAATGGIGRELLAQALEAGHEVTAVVRNPTTLPPGARTVQADLNHADSAALARAIQGADAVLSGLGPRSTADAGVASRGTRAIIGAMKEAGVRRVVVVSAAPIGTVASAKRPHPPKHDPGDGFLMRHLLSPLVKKILRKHYADLAEMEDDLQDSALDWTIVRPPRLTNRPRTRTYRTALGQNPSGAFMISRADVADAMLRALDQPETIKQVVGVAN